MTFGAKTRSYATIFCEGPIRPLNLSWEFWRVPARVGVGSQGRVRKVLECSGVVSWLVTLTGAAISYRG